MPDIQELRRHAEIARQRYTLYAARNVPQVLVDRERARLECMRAENEWIEAEMRFREALTLKTGQPQ